MEKWYKKQSFLDNPNVTSIVEGVYIYRNFITQERLQQINQILDSKAQKNQVIKDNILEVIYDVHELFSV